jgi:glucose-1-phosphate adenylyltransferase
LTERRVLALIMAGGAGTRMAPLTDHRAKPALPYAGVYRLIDFPLTNCAHSGISDVWVPQQFQPHALGEHLAGGRPWDLDRTRGGLQVLFPHQGDDESGWHQGNADAIYRNRSVIRELDPDVVVVLSADHVYQLDYRNVMATHVEQGAELTLVTTVVARDEVGRFGNVAVDGHGRVTEFRFEAYWRDVGTPESYWASHMDLLETEARLRLDDPAWPLLTTAGTRPPARLYASASLDNCLVSPGGSVRGRVERSVLGPGVVVEEGAEVFDSVLLHDVVVESGATVAAAVLDMGVRIARGASVGRRPASGSECGGDLVVLGEGVEVPPDTEMLPKPATVARR